MPNGYYRNEISGNISASPIRLNAISDLSDRKNVNINLLTHLEYERVIWLTQNEEITVKAAKKQAGQEIFKAFYADYDGEYLEDLAVATGALYGWNGDSEIEGQNTMFWTATPIESYDYAWGMKIYHWEITVDDGGRGKSWSTGYLRCVKN